MKNIAIVTGASSGMGKEFALSLKKHVKVDEIWAIAREKEDLEKLHDELDIPVVCMTMDLTEDKNLDILEKKLNDEKPNIKLLINASGFGKFEKITNISMEDNLGMIKLNNYALTKICLLSIPYMKKGSHILNFSSVAAFQPVPYISVYAATKAFVLSFSRSLNCELKKDGIHVMAICPYWTKTNFFKRAVSKNDIVKKYVVMYNAQDVINKAWKDMEKNKDVSKYGFITNLQILFCKLMPHKLIMKIWLNQQKLN